MLENGPKKQAQGAPERHRKMLQKSNKNQSFLDQNPSSEASWAPPAAEKRPTRAAPPERPKSDFNENSKPGLRQPALPNPLFTLAN